MYCYPIKICDVEEYDDYYDRYIHTDINFEAIITGLSKTEIIQFFYMYNLLPEHHWFKCLNWEIDKVVEESLIGAPIREFTVHCSNYYQIDCSCTYNHDEDSECECDAGEYTDTMVFNVQIKVE